MKFVILHGSFGNPKGNWFPWLRKEIKNLGQEVIVPKFPIDDYEKISNAGMKKAINEKQTLSAWLAVFEKEVLPKIKNELVIFIGHSLSPVFILHLVDKYKLEVEGAIFVSPFLKDLEKSDLWQFGLVNQTFYKDNFDFKKLKQKIKKSFVIYSDNDPYVRKELMLEFAEKINSDKILVESGGHLNSESGFNKFPLVLELCKKQIENKELKF
jgi:predicted alpha/beta hydrolase family esterase